MKKRIITFLILISYMLFPMNILAYSDYIIPGGENIGIEIQSKGVIIIGFYKVNGLLNKGNPELQIGDIITAVNGKEINKITELIDYINAEISNDQVMLTFKRGGNILKTTLTLTLVEGAYKTGLYVKDSLTGIGTLTYIDPDTGIYGALGHEILEGTTKKQIEVQTGKIFKSLITNITKSSNGNPGGKNADFFYGENYGSILKNSLYGIYGKYDEQLEKALLKVGTKDEVKLGNAYLWTVLNNNNVEKFEIQITKINKNSDTKNIYFKITDKKLLNKTGGIVQGMSGSPIIQNNKIVGAVTHVIVDDVQTGYGIFITTMLEEGER